MRRPGIALLACAIPLLLAACGGDPETEDGGGAPATADFPVRIEHRYGTTTVPQKPKRVVTVGFNDQDFALALGVKPVAIREWFGKGPVERRPWAPDAFGGQRPTILPAAELNVEQVAGLRPDLILGVFGGLTRREYETLSRVAPTVASDPRYRDFGTPWQQQTRMTARALGRGDRAERVVADLEREFRRARSEHPEFEGRSASLPIAEEGGTFSAYVSEDLRSRVLTDLGFRIPDRIDELAGEGFTAEISAERFRLLDQDVALFWGAPGAEREVVQADPLYRRLDAAKTGRIVYFELDDDLTGAMSFSSPLSLPYALRELVPRLAAAVDGDPVTSVSDPE